jgi:hypothetical protein
MIIGAPHTPQKSRPLTGASRAMNRCPQQENSMPKRTNLFYAQVGRTEAGSIRITIRTKNQKDQYNRYRELAVCVYKLAAEMERRTQKLGADWVVSPQVFNLRIDLELTEGDDEQAAGRFVSKVLADLGLA